ncbi:MAG: hypothetical protein A4E53_00236 [Pelotomaculum sp. PtaB.Bin104]|mgnify:CR=1 FL=1|nr:MAG: hypothetical protein A4E53_00236 [Pelotomaculum sp. PtaB.Bin104]
MSDKKKKKIAVDLAINNIGPHSGTNKINFIRQLESNKAIFYALNGTGKSFISRVFRLTSAEKTDLYADDLLTLGQDSGTFSLKITDIEKSVDKRLDISINKGTPAVVQNDSGFIFHVFNSDFVEENIKPRDYTPEGNIEGYILGKVQIDLTDEKMREEKLKDEIKYKDGTIDDIIEKAKKELRDHGILPTTTEFALVDKKRLLQKEPLGDVQPFDEIVKQLESLKQLPEKLPDINTPSFNTKDAIFDEIVTILTTAYPKAEWDEEFVSDIKKNRPFFEKGLELLNGNEGICPFCKQSLGDMALELIHRYKLFIADNEAEVIRKIESNIKAVENIIISIKQYANDTKSANVEIENLKKYFPSLEKIILEIPSSDEKAFDCFYRLISLLQDKTDNITHVDFNVEAVITECKSFIQDTLQQQKSNAAIINRVNKTKQNSNGERLILRRNLCKAQYLKLQSSLSSAFNELEKLKLELKELQQSIIEKEQQARISKKEKVYETLEYFLNKFFAGKYSIDKETFQIKFLGNNVGQKASRILSDGEKSIVAFCYYLASTHLQLSREDDYNKLFFIIDDPISSMDFHFVYAVAQSLRDIKAYFGITPYDRMWVFTHNLEFYSIVARNHIINHAYVMKPGNIEPLKHQLLMPYENHLKDIVEIASGKQEPSHTTGNSIRHVLETVSRFEYPEKSLGTYISEHDILANNSCIFTYCQDSSHGNVRNQPPYSNEVITEACKVVVEFMTSNYKGQIDAIQSKAINGET